MERKRERGDRRKRHRRRDDGKETGDHERTLT
jgi:hypothetical protein